MTAYHVIQCPDLKTNRLLCGDVQCNHAFLGLSVLGLSNRTRMTTRLTRQGQLSPPWQPILKRWSWMRKQKKRKLPRFADYYLFLLKVCHHS